MFTNSHNSDRLRLPTSTATIKTKRRRKLLFSTTSAVLLLSLLVLVLMVAMKDSATTIRSYGSLLLTTVGDVATTTYSNPTIVKTTNSSSLSLVDTGDHQHSDPKGMPPIVNDQLLITLHIKPRVWKAWPSGIPLPCYEGQVDTRVMKGKGFIFVKPKKCGSTTGSSITVRIASNVAKKQGKSMCQCSTNHRTAYNILSNFGRHRPERRHSQSFIWSIVREPTSRLMSQFFHFEVSRANVSSSDDSFMNYLQSDRKSYENFLVEYLQYMQNRDRPFDDYASVINHILQSYDFIAVTERLDESVVVLQLLLGLETSDVLYLSAKTSGGYDDGRYKNTCYLIQKSRVSSQMRKYFDSPTFKALIHYDEILHFAVNKSLDRTIDAIGRDKFNAAHHKFQTAKEAVHGKCASTVKLPCTEKGIKRNATDCIKWDIGCGFDCMDNALTELAL